MDRELIKNYIDNEATNLPLGTFLWDIDQYKRSRAYVTSKTHRTKRYTVFSPYKLIMPF